MTRRASRGQTPIDGIEKCPMSDDVLRAAQLYRRFNHFGPWGLVKVRHRRLVPPMVVELGKIVGLIYRSDKGQPGRPRTYIHLMEDPPRLVSDLAGTQLYIVGGSYRVTRRGIEG